MNTAKVAQKNVEIGAKVAQKNVIQYGVQKNDAILTFDSIVFGVTVVSRYRQEYRRRHIRCDH